MVNFYTYFITCNSTATINDVIGMLKPNISLHAVMLRTWFKIPPVAAIFMSIRAVLTFKNTTHSQIIVTFAFYLL
jgi:hypothetical protein